jgi:hypothetical protein
LKQYTESEKAQFKELYATRRRNQLMMSIPLVVVIIGVVLTEDRAGGTILGLPRDVAGPIFLAIVAAGLFYSFRNWRCAVVQQIPREGLQSKALSELRRGAACRSPA